MSKIETVTDSNRYLNCKVQPFGKTHTITLNPNESQTFKLLSFGPVKVGIILDKFSAIEQFVRDGGSTTPKDCEVFEYRSHKMLLLNPGQGQRFQFGLEKAQLILQRKEALQNFFEDYEN